MTSTLVDEDRKRLLAEFVTYAKSLAGDEKGEAQVFLDRLFRGFGRAGYKEAGATLEFRVKNNRRGTSFADLVWKPIVLIEMKKRGEVLADHLAQAFEYWVRLVPNRPRYVVLCNFDEFRVYDFDKDIIEPQDTVLLETLPDRYGPLNFLFPTNERPVFRVDRERVTREAADLLAKVYNVLEIRKGVGPATAQRFVLQMLVSLFSEDIGLLPKHFVTQLLEDCTDPPTAFDLLRGLFTAMNSPDGSVGGRFKDVAYFNGGLFATPAPVELSPQLELPLLKKAATYNWAHIAPDIFGTIFQHSMGAEERRAYGAHYTSQSDIMKIVGPTIGQPWRTAIAAARSPADLHRLRERLSRFIVLDPACGSGNFLYLAYRELKRVEKELVNRLREVSPIRQQQQREFGFVSSSQFFGIDVLPFAVELAKVTMTLAHKLAIDELHIEEQALPLDNLDNNVVCKDALIDATGNRATWPPADVIIGNPPFLGAKRLKPQRGTDYVNAVRRLYPEVPGMADYCVYWFRRAHDHLKPVSAADPVAGRAGLVGTQNIRNNQSRVGGLDYIVASGTIVEAVENQPWSGEANVHVSIANWAKTQDAALLPTQRRLWYKVEEVDGGRAQPGRRSGSASKQFELSYRDVEFISATLSDRVPVSDAKVLRCNTAPQRAFVGVMPGHSGFVLSKNERERMLKSEPRSVEVVVPYLIGREVVSGDGTPQRWIIDFGDRSLLESQSYRTPFARVSEKVLPDVRQKAVDEHRDESARRLHLERWWLHWRRRNEMKTAIVRLHGRYITGSRTQRWPFVFCFMAASVLPGDKMQVFSFDDDYSFGVLQSRPHLLWYQAKAARLKNEVDFNYSSESVFDTFAWPQTPTAEQVDAVSDAGREVRRVRAATLGKVKGGLRALYGTLALPGANPLKDVHAALDSAVLSAYGFSAKRDLLKQLLDLNHTLASAIERGELVTGPGVPPSYGDPADLISEDCIQP